MFVYIFASNKKLENNEKEMKFNQIIENELDLFRESSIKIDYNSGVWINPFDQFNEKPQQSINNQTDIDFINKSKDKNNIQDEKKYIDPFDPIWQITMTNIDDIEVINQFKDPNKIKDNPFNSNDPLNENDQFNSDDPFNGNNKFNGNKQFNKSNQKTFEKQFNMDNNNKKDMFLKNQKRDFKFQPVLMSNNVINSVMMNNSTNNLNQSFLSQKIGVNNNDEEIESNFTEKRKEILINEKGYSDADLSMYSNTNQIPDYSRISEPLDKNILKNQKINFFDKDIKEQMHMLTRKSSKASISKNKNESQKPVFLYEQSPQYKKQNDLFNKSKHSSKESIKNINPEYNNVEDLFNKNTNNVQDLFNQSSNNAQDQFENNQNLSIESEKNKQQKNFELNESQNLFFQEQKSPHGINNINKSNQSINDNQNKDQEFKPIFLYEQSQQENQQNDLFNKSKHSSKNSIKNINQEYNNAQDLFNQSSNNIKDQFENNQNSSIESEKNKQQQNFQLNESQNLFLQEQKFQQETNNINKSNQSIKNNQNNDQEIKKPVFLYEQSKQYNQHNDLFNKSKHSSKNSIKNINQASNNAQDLFNQNTNNIEDQFDNNEKISIKSEKNKQQKNFQLNESQNLFFQEQKSTQETNNINKSNQSIKNNQNSSNNQKEILLNEDNLSIRSWTNNKTNQISIIQNQQEEIQNNQYKSKNLNTENDSLNISSISSIDKKIDYINNDLQQISKSINSQKQNTRETNNLKKTAKFNNITVQQLKKKEVKKKKNNKTYTNTNEKEKNSQIINQELSVNNTLIEKIRNEISSLNKERDEFNKQFIYNKKSYFQELKNLKLKKIVVIDKLVEISSFARPMEKKIRNYINKNYEKKNKINELIIYECSQIFQKSGDLNSSNIKSEIEHHFGTIKQLQIEKQKTNTEFEKLSEKLEKMIIITDQQAHLANEYNENEDKIKRIKEEIKDIDLYFNTKIDNFNQLIEQKIQQINNMNIYEKNQ